MDAYVSNLIGNGKHMQALIIVNSEIKRLALNDLHIECKQQRLRFDLMCILEHRRNPVPALDYESIFDFDDDDNMVPDLIPANDDDDDIN